MKLVYEGIEVTITEGNIHVHNSYLVTDDDKKRDLIHDLLENVAGLKEHRTEKSMLNEWKAHNIFYQHGWFKDHTADVDFEFKQKWYYKIGYWLVAHLMREIVL